MILFEFTNKIHPQGLIFSAKEEYQLPIINTNMTAKYVNER